MNYNYFETKFKSNDGKSTVFCEIYTPKTITARGVVQISHGMMDYISRYEGLADYLTGEGYIVAGNHHLGHGKSAASDDDLGFFAEAGGVDILLSDLHTMNKYLRSTFPALPVFLLGHSMGSFLSRLYAVKYPHSVSGVIIHGTAGPNRMLPIGRMLAAGKRITRGARYRSKTINSLVFSGYNSHFDKSEGEWAWLTRETALVAGRSEDKYTSFTFTLAGFMDLFDMIGECNSREWFSEYPKDMPTLIVSGDADPVGAYGKGPSFVYKHLLMEKMLSSKAEALRGRKARIV